MYRSAFEKQEALCAPYATVIDIDSKEVFQSDAVQSLYPNEKGRNK